MSLRTPLRAAADAPALELAGGSATPELALRAPERQRSAARALALIGAGTVLASTLLIVLCAAATPTLLPETIRAILGVPALAGVFAHAGFNLHWGGVIAVLLTMLSGYVLVARGATRLSARTVLMLIAAVHALILLAPPLFSTDVFSYQAYARLGLVYNASPYLHGPSAIQLDPLYPFVGADWVTTPTAYGPVFTLLSYLLNPFSIAASVVAYKAIAAVSSLAVVALVWNGARLRGIDPRRAAALVGLNPLIVVYGVGGGHNDLLMLVPLLAGVYLTLAHRERAGGGAIALAAGLKLTAGLVLPFALAGGARGPLRDRRRELLVGVGVAIATMAILGVVVFGDGPLHLVGTLSHNQSRGEGDSVGGLFSKLGLTTASHVAVWLLGATFLGICGRLLLRVWRGGLDWVDGAAWATLALLMCAGSLQAWYLAWLMPLAALGIDRRLGRVALIASAVMVVMQLIGYIPGAGYL